MPQFKLAASLCSTYAQPVPTALPVDYGEIKAAFCKGVPISTLAKEYNLNEGSLRSVATRQKWSKVKAKADSSVLKAAQLDIAGHVNSHIERMIGFANNALSNIESRGFNGKLDDLQTLVGIADKLDLMQRRTLRMDEQQARASTLVSVVVNGANSAEKRDFIELNGESVKLLDESSEQ